MIVFLHFILLCNLNLKFSNKFQIDFFHELYEQIDKMESNHTFDVWLLINMKSFKFTLLNEICKWSNIFKQHLLKHINQSLFELDSFITEGIQIFGLPVQKDDFTTLLKIMSVLSQIRDRQKRTNCMFQPLKDIIETLKQYNVEISSEMQEHVSFYLFSK